MAGNNISSGISALYMRIEDLQRQSERCPAKTAELLSSALEELRAIQQEINTFEGEMKRRDQELAKAEELFQTALEFTYDWETLIAPDGNYIYVSPSCERITGYSADKFLRDPGLMERIIHPLDRELFPRYFKCQEDNANSIEFRIVARNGEERWISHFCQPVFNSLGHYVGRRASNRDITKRRRAEDAALRAKEDWEQTFAAMPDLISIIDNDFRIVRANKAMAARLSTTTESLAGLKCYHAMHGTDEPPSFCPHKLMIEDGVEHIMEVHEDRLGGDYLVSVSPLVDAKGRIIGSAHVARDITERKHALVALQQSNKKLDMALEAADAGTWDMNIATGVIEWSPKVFEMFGLDQRESVPSMERWNALLHPEDIKRANFQISQALKSHTRMDIEYRIVRPDGKTRWINILGESICNDHGAPDRMIGICIDITERKMMEQALKESEEHLRLASHGAKFGTYTYDFRSGEAQWSPELKALWGLSADDPVVLDEDSLFVGLHYADRSAFLAAMNAANDPNGDGDLRLEYRVIIPDGSIRWLEVRGHTEFAGEGENNRPLRAAGAVIDITERKRLEKMLARERDWARKLLDIAGFIILVLDRDGKITLVNERACEILARRKEEIVGTDWIETFIPERMRDEVNAYFKKVVSGELESVEHLENPVLTGRGEERIIFWRNSIIRDENGKTIGTLSSGEDITERKEAEVALLEAKLGAEADKARYEQVVTMISDMVWRYDANSKGEHVSFYISPVADRMLGLPDGTIGNSIEKYFSHIHPDDFPVMQEVVSEAIRTHAKDMFTEYRMKKADGSIIWVRSRGSVHSQPDGGITAIGTTSDITELKRDEEQLKRYSEHLTELVEERTKRLKDAERLATIGETALMVGHDLRNPLQAIVNTAYLAESKIESLSPQECNNSMNQSLLEYLRTIDRQSEYMNKIVSDLQDYARPLRPEIMEISLSSFVADVLAGMKIPEDIDVQTEIEDRLSWKVDPTMMVRVLVNLVNNAIQAMPTKGTLIITAFSSEKGMVLNVEDDGVGIPSDLIPKIFNPLFTTKPKGMGLGLVVARRMVEAQGGSLDLNSNAGKGTIAVIRMPHLPDALLFTGNGILGQ